MNKYEHMDYDELRRLPGEEFSKIPKKILDAAASKYYKELPPEKRIYKLDEKIISLEDI